MGERTEATMISRITSYNVCYTKLLRMCFYRKAADMVADAGGKKVFSRLAGEKQDHVSRFFRYYRGTEFGTRNNFV